MKLKRGTPVTGDIVGEARRVPPLLEFLEVLSCKFKDGAFLGSNGGKVITD